MAHSRSRSKLGSRTLVTFLIAIVVVLMLLILLYISGIPYFTKLTPCYPPPWVSVDGAAVAKVYIFYDANQNGQPDEGERPLPNITAQMGPETGTTTEDGFTTLYLFKENCACNCTKGEIISVQLPQGWITTKPNEIRLSGNETQINIGLIKQ